MTEHNREIYVTKYVHMEPENFNTLQNMIRENSQGATNAVISSKSLFFLLFQLVYISRIDV